MPSAYWQERCRDTTNQQRFLNVEAYEVCPLPDDENGEIMLFKMMM